MLALILGAAVLGIVIAVMEDGEFPGWVNMILCVLATVVPAGIVNAFLPRSFSFVGLLVGAVIGAFVISALCGMSVARAAIAVGIYFAIQVAFIFLLTMVFVAAT